MQNRPAYEKVQYEAKHANCPVYSAIGYAEETLVLELRMCRFLIIVDSKLRLSFSTNVSPAHPNEVVQEANRSKCDPHVCALASKMFTRCSR